MNKQEYIDNWIDRLNNAMSIDNQYKFEDNLIQCKCNYDKFYLYGSMLICSRCFTEYCIPYDYFIERL